MSSDTLAGIYLVIAAAILIVGNILVTLRSDAKDSDERTIVFGIAILWLPIGVGVFGYRGFRFFLVTLPLKIRNVIRRWRTPTPKNVIPISAGDNPYRAPAPTCEKCGQPMRQK